MPPWEAKPRKAGPGGRPDREGLGLTPDAGYLWESMKPRVVVHLPHASTVIPPDAAPTLSLSESEAAAELLAMTDWYTDELFDLPTALAKTVRFPISRLVVDPERFTDDAQELMAARGMGVVYTRTSDGRRLRPEPTREERASLLARFYEPHHSALTSAVADALAAHGTCLVIDGHSFPARPLPYEVDQTAARPDICIGTDPHHTPLWVRDLAVTAFEQAGFSVAVDRPFAGALVPMAYYGSDTRVTAFMVEVNRGLYMNEHTGERLAQFSELRSRVLVAIERIIVAWSAR